MAAQRKLNLDEESASIVAEAIDSGAFRAPEDVVREALKTWQAAGRRVADLRIAIEEGAASGPGVPAEEVFAELELRYRETASGQA
jgi:antitoxin ParD1/3/4